MICMGKPSFGTRGPEVQILSLRPIISVACGIDGLLGEPFREPLHGQ